MQIIESAFGLREAAGGAAGYGVMQAVRYGIARGLFSNEAGQGSAPIAHAAARTKNPVQQGEIAMIGVFIDTIVICTMTALVILTVTGDFKKSGALMAANQCIEAGQTLPEGTELDTLFPSAYAEGRAELIAANGAVATAWLQECQAAGVLIDVDHAWETDANSAAITTRAYGAAFPGGEFIVPVALFFFAFTTIIGWSYYGEQAVTYMIGEWATHPFRYVWVIVIFLGAIASADWLWLLGDIANASMAFPNLIAIIALSSVVVAMHKLNDDPDHGHPVIDKTEPPSNA
jgi:AGCS family alanine or glycine:cation symporter